MLSDFDLTQMTFFRSYEDANVGSFIEHMKRVELADAGIPLILSSDGTILDGMHRLTKAVQAGLVQIAIVQFPVDPEPLRVVDLSENSQSHSEL